MQIRTLDNSSGYDLPMEDLMEYLARVVLTKTDTEIERASKELALSKTQLSEARKQLTSNKERLISTAREYERLRLMATVLRKIDTLRREGVLVGANKAKTVKILNGIESHSVKVLKSLEERLSAYVPEAPKISYG